MRESVDTGPAATSSSSPPLRVLMLIDKLRAGGGAERAMVAFATHLPRDRFDVRVATTRPSGGPLLDAVQTADIPHLALERRHRFDASAWRRLLTYLREQRIDVLHAHMFGSNLWGSMFGRLAGVPTVIAQDHTWSYEGQRLRRILDGFVIGRLADVFIAVSTRDRDRMIELEGVPAHKLIVMPNPYVPRPPRPAVDLRERLGIPQHAPVVVTVAVLRPQKALHVLLDAFAGIASSMPDARLIVAGDGSCRGALEAQARALGLSDRAHFLGWWEDLASVMRVADVAAMSSDYEGSPLFALECMAHRVPLVSTDVGNVAELFEAGRSVMLVPTRDHEALARALEALLRDPSRRHEQARLAAVRMERFEIASVAGEFGDLYERLAARPGRRNHRSGPDIGPGRR